MSLNIQNDFVFLGSETLFHYLLFNLLKNALCYISEKPKITISITIESTATTRNLYFRDTGIGIPADKMDQLFDNFITSNKAEGIGLGLAFCKRVMQSFGGSIRCISELGQYTEFKLTFPIEKVQGVPQDRPLENTTHTVSGGMFNLSSFNRQKFNKQKVLIIEDEIIARTMLENLLKTVNIDLHFANDGMQGVKQAKKLQPQIILTDLNLHKLGGIDLINALRQLAHKSIIISVSGNYPDKDVEHKLDDVIVKPASKQHLLEKLHQHLDRNSGDNLLNGD